MTNVQTQKRKRAERLGRYAERFAALALVCKGYRIVALRYKTKLGEIDLIARRNNLVVMVEVKARATVEQAIDSVSDTSRHRINNAADLWLGKQPDAHKLSIRFDIMAITPWRWPSHFEDAF